MAQPVIVIARARIAPAAREPWLAAARACILATREEAGCLAYDLHESVGEPGSFVFVERWRDRAALEAHMAAPHVQILIAVTGRSVTEPPSVEAVEGSERWRLL